MATVTGKKASFYWVCWAILLTAVGSASSSRTSPPDKPEPTEPVWSHPRSDERLDERKDMVEQIEKLYDLHDREILDAMLNVPRHWFVPAAQQRDAYRNSPLPIGHGQTISQPFIVAYMTSLLAPDPNDVILEVGTGSGYQAAVLSEFTPHVYSIEILEPLAETAKKTLQKRGYHTIKLKCGDGYKGWPKYAPFDAIIVTCAPENIPEPLVQQLKPDGKIVIPVGGRFSIQHLLLVTKDKKGNPQTQSMMPVRFVPLVRDKK